MARIRIRISKKELWEPTNQEHITQQLCRRREWRWIRLDWTGHTLRRPFRDITHQVRPLSGTCMENDELGVQGEGDMEEMVCEEEIKGYEQWWSQVEKTTENRLQWRCATKALCSTKNARDNNRNKQISVCLLETRKKMRL
ncbi:unnamed protein product [Heterobilharzia americana]|nr:unnamed protein product [Heterobilharzia americana]